MSSTAGRKRKLNGREGGVDSDAEAGLHHPLSKSHAAAGVHSAPGSGSVSPVPLDDGPGDERTQELFARIQQLQAERKQIEEGLHPEWVRKSEALQRVKDRRVFAADRFKQMQIENIHGLYEYELREADASYKVSMEDLKGRLLESMEHRIKKLEDDRDRVLKQLERVGQGRVLRSKFPAGHDGSGTDGTATPVPQARAEEGPPPTATVSIFLTDMEIKDDLKRITADLAERAKAYYNAETDSMVDVFVEDNCLHYGEHCLLKGESVVFTSMMSGEDFYGRLASIRPHEVLVKLTDGTKARIHLSYLRNGRIRLKVGDDYALED